MCCCGDNRFTLIEKVKRDFIETTNITDAELAVLDSMCFRMWQLGLLKKYDDIDENKLDELAYALSNKESADWWESAMEDYKNRPDKETQYNQFIGFNTFSDILLNKLAEAYKAGYRKAMED